MVPPIAALVSRVDVLQRQVHATERRLAGDVHAAHASGLLERPGGTREALLGGPIGSREAGPARRGHLALGALNTVVSVGNALIAPFTLGANAPVAVLGGLMAHHHFQQAAVAGAAADLTASRRRLDELHEELEEAKLDLAAALADP